MLRNHRANAAKIGAGDEVDLSVEGRFSGTIPLG